MGGIGFKKSRAKTYTKVTRKHRNELKRVNMKNITKDPVLKKNYDPKKTWIQNISQASMLQYADMLPEEITIKHVVKLSDDERIMLEKLMKRHGTDTKAWERDRRLNPYQWTAHQCSNKLKLYEKLMEEKKESEEKSEN